MLNSQSQGTLCFHSKEPKGTADASIATLLKEHGLSIEPRDIERWTANSHLDKHEIFYVLSLLRQLNFSGEALEGGITDLPEVARPNIVLLKSASGSPPTFAVLFDINSEQAIYGDPILGRVMTMPTVEFAKIWTGSAINVIISASSIDALKLRLSKDKDFLYQLRLKMGLTPPYYKQVGFVAATVALVWMLIHRFFDWFEFDPMVHTVLVLILIFCLWSKLFSASCNSCNRARALTGGLPLSEAGLIFYSTLFMLSVIPSHGLPLLLLMGLAFGIHTFLIGLLIKHRLVCYSCFGIAAAVIGLVTNLIYHEIMGSSLLETIPAFLGLLGAAALGASFSGVAIWVRRKLATLNRLQTSFRLIKDEFTKPMPVPNHVRLTVYKRAGCVACTYYESVVGPALRENYPDALEIREVEAGKLNVSTPLFIFQSRKTVLMSGISPEELYGQIEKVIQALLETEPLGNTSHSLGVCLLLPDFLTKGGRSGFFGE